MTAFRSLRTRLTFWYAAMLLGGLLGFAGWMWFAMHQYLAASADDRIVRRLQGLRSVIEQEANASFDRLSEELREFAMETPEGELTAARGRGGRELLRPAGMPEQVLWRAPQGSTIGNIGNLYVGATRYRALRTRIAVSDQTYDLAVATSTAEADKFLKQFRLLLIGAAPMLALAAAFGGYWMSRRALAPVDQLTSAARLISLDNLAQRLEVRKTGDELERLGRTWNQMLQRLDDAVQRMRQFTADASHELRTPISIIRTTAELALRRERDPAAYRKALESVQREAEWMTQLAEDLLLLARDDAGSLKLRNEPLAVDNLARAVAGETAPMAEVRGISLCSRLEAGDAQVNGDHRALHRLLSILLDNAVEHTPAQGTIEIETSAAGGQVVIAVRNTGEGIRNEDLPHIFERFYRGDRARTRQNGAGLGLAIARSIAHAHGAAIEVESTTGHGATFSVKLPALLKQSSTAT